MGNIKSRGSDSRQVHHLPYRHWSVGGVRESPHGSYTRHNFLIHRGLKSRNLFIFPDFNQPASWRIRIIVYIYIFFSLSITPSANAVAAGMSMISRFILMIEPQTLRVDCLLQNPWRHFRTLSWWRHDELTSLRETTVSTIVMIYL